VIWLVSVPRLFSGAFTPPTLVTLETRTASVQSYRYIDYLVPGILAMSLMQLGLYSAVTLVVQGETRLLRRLGATPLPRSTVIARTAVGASRQATSMKTAVQLPVACLR